MPILRLLKGSPYGPREIEVMTKAYEEALRLLNVTDRTSPIAESIAQRTIALFFWSGETDVLAIAQAVSEEFASIRNNGWNDSVNAREARPE